MSISMLPRKFASAPVGRQPPGASGRHFDFMMTKAASGRHTVSARPGGFTMKPLFDHHRPPTQAATNPSYQSPALFPRGLRRDSNSLSGCWRQRTNIRPRSVHQRSRRRAVAVLQASSSRAARLLPGGADRPLFTAMSSEACHQRPNLVVGLSPGQAQVNAWWKT